MNNTISQRAKLDLISLRSDDNKILDLRAAEYEVDSRVFNSNISVRQEAAGDRNTDADSLRILSRDEYKSVRRAVANNRSCPVYILDGFYHTDYDEQVRENAFSLFKYAQLS